METIETRINDFKNVLQASQYITKFYGRTFKFREKTAEKRVIISPSVVSDRNELEIVRPNDNEEGMLFFYVKDKANVLDYHPDENNTFKYNVDLIMWINSERQSHWQGLEIFLYDTRKLLRSFPQFCLNTISYEAETIMEGFTLDEAEKQYFCHPYYGAKFSGTIEFMENSCGF